MLSLDLPFELLISILNTYLRCKYDSLERLCEVEDLDRENLQNIILENNYEYCSSCNQIRPKN